MHKHVILFFLALSFLLGFKENAFASHSDTPEKFWARPINMSAITKSRLGDDVETLKEYWDPGYSSDVTTTKLFGLDCALMHLIKTKAEAEFIKALKEDPRLTALVSDFDWDTKSHQLFTKVESDVPLDHPGLFADLRKAIEDVKAAAVGPVAVGGGAGGAGAADEVSTLLDSVKTYTLKAGETAVVAMTEAEAKVLAEYVCKNLAAIKARAEKSPISNKTADKFKDSLQRSPLSIFIAMAKKGEIIDIVARGKSIPKGKGTVSVNLSNFLENLHRFY